jgi:hypothetical protein
VSEFRPDTGQRNSAGFAPFLVGNRFLQVFDFGCRLISQAPFSVED